MKKLKFFAPPASDNPEEHADWLEIRALKSADGFSSIIDLEREFRRSGSVEGVEDFDEVDYLGSIDPNIVSDIAIDGFGEIEDRFRSCGKDEEAYPFNVQNNYLERSYNSKCWVYVFLLLLSRFGREVGPKRIKATKVFEEICGEASQAYLGGPSELVGKCVFGFPRKRGAGFRKALRALLHDMGEGDGARTRISASKKKDDGLDIVSWRGFLDSRKGKLMAFGQCATGNDWKSKLTELSADAFCKIWMNEMPAVDPIRMFFVPHRVNLSEWYEHCAKGGILFDRCRISYYSRNLGDGFVNQCKDWSQFVLKRVKGSF